RLDPENLLVMVDCLGKGSQGFLVLKVADMVTDKSITVTRKCESILQMRASRQCRSGRKKQADRQGRVSAGTSEEIWLIVYKRDHGIVNAGFDGSVMQQKGIGDITKFFECIFVLGHNGIFTQI